MSKLDHMKIGDTDYEIQDSELTEKVSSLETSVTAVQTEVANKQDKLTAGDNITIDENNVISASGGDSSGGTKLYKHYIESIPLGSHDDGALILITPYSTPITSMQLLKVSCLTALNAYGRYTYGPDDNLIGVSMLLYLDEANSYITAFYTINGTVTSIKISSSYFTDTVTEL